ncbi:hypothetical protein Ct61P_14667 [Colletotrichum tofieldiae]|nr:hypothetical protein Ct61P_14667 [Colletotrichum tofieldiae]
MMLIAVALQDHKAQALYIYDLLPKMEEVGKKDLAGRYHGDAAAKGTKRKRELEQEQKEVMKAWLKSKCVQDSAWPVGGQGR